MIARLRRLYHRAARAYWGTIVTNQARAGMIDTHAMGQFAHHSHHARAITR